MDYTEYIKILAMLVLIKKIIKIMKILYWECYKTGFYQKALKKKGVIGKVIHYSPIFLSYVI